jgi:hypothetical protein
MRRIFGLALAILACSSIATVARAERLWGLTAANQLFSFDSATPSSITAPVTISQAGIVDIDFNNVNGSLYGRDRERLVVPNQSHDGRGNTRPSTSYGV